MKTRWWCLILLLLMGVVVGGGGSAQARGPDPDACQAGRLKPRNVSASLDFDYHDRSYAQVISDLIVSVSAKEWPLATDLALGEQTPGYQMAMRCLLRGEEEVPRNREWRFRDPKVTVRGDLVTVDYEATAWIEQARPFLIGPWRIDVDSKGKSWRVRLRPPKTLESAKWGQVEVKLDGLEASNIFPREASSADSDRLVWSEPPPFAVQVYVDPPGSAPSTSIRDGGPWAGWASPRGGCSPPS